MDAIDTCTHPWMKKARGIASRLVDAALCAAEGSHDMLARGRLWALLGSFRLLLVQPPPGVDPASKHQSKRVAINMCLKYQVCMAAHCQADLQVYLIVVAAI